MTVSCKFGVAFLGERGKVRWCVIVLHVTGPLTSLRGGGGGGGGGGWWRVVAAMVLVFDLSSVALCVKSRFSCF